MNSILDAEHHLKSIFAYRFAEEYKGKHYAYLDINSYSDKEVLNVGFLISKLSKIINKNKNYPNNSIYYYEKKYKDVPIWVLVDYLEFGDLVHLIKCLPESLQNKISKDLTSFILDKDNKNKFSPKIMISFMENIREVRNICAHNNRLLDFKCRADTKYFKDLHEKNDINQNQKRTRTYSTFINLQCFLSKTEYTILNNTLRKRFKYLSNKVTSIEMNEITKLLGFPDDWYKKEAMSQN